MKNLNIHTNATIKEAMEALDKTAENVLLIVDENKKLIGTLTDGDVRRYILMRNDLKGTIAKAYNSDPIYIYEKDFELEKIKKTLTKNKIDLIPIINDQKIVVDYITWENVFGNGEKTHKSSKNINVPVIIMAGGKGTRLEPFTKVLPKSLIPIDGKPVINCIIDKFVEFGIKEFHITVNYMAKIMKAYFDELNPKYNISFVEEKKPLGTAGSLKLLQGCFKQPFFVSNCDIIINTSYYDLYIFHKKNNYDMTIVASVKNYNLPYGKCELDSNGCLKKIIEKPEFSFLVNTGLYILNPDVLNLIPQNKFYHITELMDEVKRNNGKVGVFPVSENAWIDIGEWSEYKKARERFKV